MNETVVLSKKSFEAMIVYMKDYFAMLDLEIADLDATKEEPTGKEDPNWLLRDRRKDFDAAKALVHQVEEEAKSSISQLVFIYQQIKRWSDQLREIRSTFASGLNDMKAYDDLDKLIEEMKQHQVLEDK